MVFWIVATPMARADVATTPKQRFGPYESESAALAALRRIQDGQVGTSPGLQVVCDFA